MTSSLPGNEEDILAASLMGTSGVVLGWKYSSQRVLRLTATIHSSTPYWSNIYSNSLMTRQVVYNAIVAYQHCRVFKD